MKKITLFALLSLTFAITALATDNTFNETTVKAYSTGTKGAFLAGAHVEMGLACTDCHGMDAKVSDNGIKMNNTCMDCHADMHGMAEISAEDLESEYNPHEGHIKTMQCTTCHTAHKPSVLYCNNCHTFNDMRIPYQSGTKTVYQVEDLRVYDDIEPSRVEETDVLIIGAGGAGFSATVSAHQNGAKVILVEKMPLIGGNTQLAAGGMNVAGTEYQRAEGITGDSVKIYYEDTMKGGRNINDPKLVKYLTENAYKSLKWLESLDARLTHLSFSGGQRFKRVHTAHGGAPVGAYIISTMNTYAQKHNLDIRVNTKAVKLLTDKNGKVIGARMSAEFGGIYDIMADSIILATGGFGANNALVGQYRADLIGTTTSNHPGAIGDGLVLAESIGADFTDIGEIQIHPTVALNTKILISESVRGSGAILINNDGKRFVNEMRTRDQVSAEVLKQQIKNAYVVFDDQIRQDMGLIEGYIKLGLVMEANSLDELAKKMNVSAKNLNDSIARYNMFIKNKKDEDFGRGDMIKPIAKGKFYAVKIAPGIHHTMGGVKINDKTQVINTSGKTIKGLYAAGEITGGVHGGNRLGGNAIADIVTFGRLAGQEAAKNAK